MRIEIPGEALYIIDMLEDGGYEAYVVGGCVRDSLRGIIPKDWDICTNALPGQTAELFRQCRLIETGLAHGTLTLMLSGMPFEVTTYRIDGKYSDYRRPDEVGFTSDLKEDLARRDFTINAMAYSPKHGLVDFFGGPMDLKEGVIKCVGDPDRRFHEDALRIMRALRFASVLGFSIEGDTSNAMLKNKALLKNIAVERIAGELNKLIAGINVRTVLADHLPVIVELIPELAQVCILESIESAPADAALRLAMLFSGIPQISADMAKEILMRLKYDNKTVETVTVLVSCFDAEIKPCAEDIKRWLNKIGEGRLRQLLEIRAAGHDELKSLIDEVIDQNQCYSLKDLAVNGSDLIKIGMSEGERVGAALNKLLNMVIDGEAENDKISLLEAAKRVIINSEK